MPCAGGQAEQRGAGFGHGGLRHPTGGRHRVGAGLDFVGIRGGIGIPLRVQFTGVVAKGDGEVGDLSGQAGGRRRAFHIHAGALDFGRVAAALRLHIGGERGQCGGQRIHGVVALGEVLALGDEAGLIGVVGRRQAGDESRDGGERRNGRGEARIAGHRGLDVVGGLEELLDVQSAEV